MFRITSCIFRTIKINVTLIRTHYGVYHNPNRHIFYVKLTNNDRAVLLYKKDKNVMDIRSINVPREQEGRGLARTLAEAALTYAIVHDYRIILTCEYMQKFYLATKTPELAERVIGPSNILEASKPELIDPEKIDELPDPQDAINDDQKS